MNPVDSFSRRDLIKLMALAGASMIRPVSLLAGVVPGDTAISPGALTGHPRLSDHTTSPEHLRQALAPNAAADSALRKHGEELPTARLIPEAGRYLELVRTHPSGALFSLLRPLIK